MPLPKIAPQKAKPIAPPKNGVDVMAGQLVVKTTPAFKGSLFEIPQLGLGVGRNK